MSMALVQICPHDGMVGAHVIGTDGGRTVTNRDSISAVLLGFFQLTWEDWIANRWRLEVRTVEEVRVMPICELHTVTDA